MALYMDSSALVKLVIRESDSDQLRRFVGDREMATSQISRVELIRAVARNQPESVDAAQDLLSELTLISLSRVITSRAAWVPPPFLRSLDALHVASANTMRDSLDALVTYDGRMIEAGRLAGLRVASPGVRSE
jgi:predicted nucleic acid-binding protein